MMPDKISCLIVDDEPVARDVLESHLQKINTIDIVASCKSAMEAFNALNEKNIDLIFLDINMPGISGLSFAKSINRDLKIIFTTAYRDYAVEGFDLQAVDYLLKPISLERIIQAVNKYIDESQPVQGKHSMLTLEEKQDHIYVRSDRKMIKIPFADIMFIESIGDYIKICMRNKTVTTRETITGIEAKLPHEDFLRTHRSFLVSIPKIDSYTSEYIEIGNSQIPVSRNYKESVMSRLEG